jgi:undecaprenyl-diphosphatase
MASSRPAFLFGIAALALLWLAMLLLGAGPVDRMLLLDLYAADRPWFALAAMGFTYLGNGTTLVAITLAASIWLMFRRRFGAALLLLIATATGRALVVLEKIYFARLRPEENLRLVEVNYLSFPSGHAGNSMMVFLGIALLVPEDPAHRRRAVAAALLLTFLIGLSRPMLGVHWPSDVVGGWAFGALWLLLLFAAADRFAPAARR